MLATSDLMNRLRVVLEADTNPDLVYKLRLRGVQVDETRISNWSNNKAIKGPHWVVTIPMLEIAGWLSPAALAEAAAGPAAEANEISGQEEAKGKPRRSGGTAGGGPR